MGLNITHNLIKNAAAFLFVCIPDHVKKVSYAFDLGEKCPKYP